MIEAFPPPVFRTPGIEVVIILYQIEASSERPKFIFLSQDGFPEVEMYMYLNKNEFLTFLCLING